MIEIEEIKLKDIDIFFNLQLNYLIDDEIIDLEDLEYFKSLEYRNAIINNIKEGIHHLIYFIKDGIKIGIVSYAIYKEENNNCFILDFWIYKEYRNNNLGHLCFNKLEEITKGLANSYEINASKENSIRFWKSLGFIENGTDEYGDLLFIKINN